MDIERLLSFSNLPLIDVRSPSEFKQGHIPGAMNHPILNDQERKSVGICYKQQGREAAIALGYDLVGDQLGIKVQGVKEAISGDKAIVYCWRGGLRSKIFTENLVQGGLKIDRLALGYKSYRNWALTFLEKCFPIIVLGGPTGVGKTEILHFLRAKGEQVLDLEGLANHRGSAFGGIGMPEQPSNEQFENEIAFQLFKFDKNKPIWVENESRRLGKVKLPNHLYDLIRSAKVLVLQAPLEKRVDRIVRDYAILPKEALKRAIEVLHKRLGHKRMTDAIQHLEKGENEQWIKLMLAYYDKMYDYGNSQREKHKVFFIDIESKSPEKIVEHILKQYKRIEKDESDPIDAI